VVVVVAVEPREEAVIGLEEPAFRKGIAVVETTPEFTATTEVKLEITVVKAEVRAGTTVGAVGATAIRW
jgi:hypothetical protein